MLMAECLDLLAPEQYGSHSGLATIYHSLNMQLSLDIIRQKKIPAAICSNDAKSCYNCIVHSFAAIALMRLGVPMNPIRMMFATIQELKHFIQMAHGDSKRFFSGPTSGKLNQGVGQGNGVGPQIWAAISSPIFEYVCKQGYGVKFIASISQKCTHVAGFGFVDDVDLLAANDSMEQTREQVVDSLQGCLNSWELGLRVSGGGALSAHKSHWTLIDFNWDGAFWWYAKVQDYLTQLTMKDASGRWLPLQCLECNEAERALGLRLLPDGVLEGTGIHMGSTGGTIQDGCSYDMDKPQDSTAHKNQLPPYGYYIYMQRR